MWRRQRPGHRSDPSDFRRGQGMWPWGLCVVGGSFLPPGWGAYLRDRGLLRLQTCPRGSGSVRVGSVHGAPGILEKGASYPLLWSQGHVSSCRVPGPLEPPIRRGRVLYQSSPKQEGRGGSFSLPSSAHGSWDRWTDTMRVPGLRHKAARLTFQKCRGLSVLGVGVG